MIKRIFTRCGYFKCKYGNCKGKKTCWSHEHTKNIFMWKRFQKMVDESVDI